MRRIIAIIIVAAIAVAFAYWVAGLTGTVGVTIAGTTVEASAPVAVLLFLVVVLVAYLIVWIIGALLATPAAIGRAQRRGRRNRGDSAITRTLVAIAAGDRTDARRESVRARQLLGDTPQTMLLAAEAYRLAGDESAAADIYRKLAERDDAAFLGLRGLFRQAVAQERWDEAADIADRAERLHPGAAWLREERAQLAMRTENWSQALALAGPGAPVVALRTAAAEAEPDQKKAIGMARQAFEADEGFAPAAIAYARLLRAEGRESRAVEVIRSAWKLRPHPDLAAFFLEGAKSPAERLTLGGRLAVANPAHYESLLLLARLNLAAGHPADARRHVEAARSAGCNQRRVWMLLADIEAAEHGDSEASRLGQRDALRHAADADPDPAWRCETCGTIHAAWHPACPVCHTVGRIVWGTPKAVAQDKPVVRIAEAVPVPT